MAYIALDKLDSSGQQPSVTLFLPTLIGGGAERVQLHLAKYFSERGLRVDMVVCKYVGSLRNAVPDNVRVVSLDASRVLLALPKYLRYLRIARPPLVLSSVENASIIACLGRALSPYRHKLFVRHDNALLASGSLWSEPRRAGWLAAIAATFRYADAIVGVSKGVVKQLARMPGLKRVPIHCVYNPVIGADFQHKLAQAPSLPKRHGGVRTIVAVGRLHPVKDYPTLLRAFALAQAEMPLRLLMLGEGDQQAELETMTRSLGIADHVHFLGFVHNPPAYMHRSDLLVLSSISEGLPGVLIEALAAGVPVVSTDCPHGPREVLADGRFGTLVPVGDPAELAKAILDALRAPKPAPDLRLAEHLLQFTIEYSGSRYMELMGLRAIHGV